MTSPFLKARKEGLTLQILLAPRSKSNSIRGMHGDRLKIALTAPPVDGKANAALCKFLAKLFGVRLSDIAVIHGLTSREKVVAVAGVELAAAESILKPLLSDH